MQASMGVAMSLELTPLVGARQVWDEILLATGSPIVEVLINRLMADTEAGVVDGESTGDLLGRPSDHQFAPHVAPDTFAFETWSSVCLAPASSCALLCSVGQIHVVNRRLVPAEFS
jgi:hypothetical protein